MIGAQIGTRIGTRLKAEQLRILLALLVLAVCVQAGARPAAAAGRALFGRRRGGGHDAPSPRSCCSWRCAAPGRGPRKRSSPGSARTRVSITANFDGSEILIFGAVKRDAPQPAGPLEVIITVAGPTQPLVTVRRKARRFGIWVNARCGRWSMPRPSFYAVATSAPWHADP